MPCPAAQTHKPVTLQLLYGYIFSFMSSTNDMTVGSPARDIAKFATPLIAGYILQQMYLIIDAVIVGRWIGVGALAAVGASTSILFLILGFCNGCCAGFAIPVAQTFGGKDFSKMRAYVANAVRITLILAFFITLFTCCFCHRILSLVNTPDDIRADAYTFLFLQFASIPFIMGYNLLAGFIRALGNSKQPFFFIIAASLLNIALDIVLVLFLHAGVAGVGVATLLSQGFSALLCHLYIRRHMAVLIPHGAERVYHDRMVSRLLGTGVPMGLQFSITGIGIIMLQSANNALGTTYVAAFTASIRIKYLFTCVFDNIGVAMATYCGQNIGAGRIDRVTQGIRDALYIMLAYSCLTLLVIYPFADRMMEVFVNGDQREIISNAALYMRINNYFYPILGVLNIFRCATQGLGFSNLSMMSGVMEMFARSGVSLWLVPAFRFTGVCFGDPVAWVAADAFLIPAYIYVIRRCRKKTAAERLARKTAQRG